MVVELLRFLAGVLIVAGAVFGLLAAVGVLRLPDLYTRMHAASKAGTVGSGLVLTAIMVVSFDGPVVLRALIGIVFIILTTPISAHLLAKAAYSAGYDPDPITKTNELKNTEKTAGAVVD